MTLKERLDRSRGGKIRLWPADLQELVENPRCYDWLRALPPPAYERVMRAANLTGDGDIHHLVDDMEMTGLKPDFEELCRIGVAVELEIPKGAPCVRVPGAAMTLDELLGLANRGVMRPWFDMVGRRRKRVWLCCSACHRRLRKIALRETVDVTRAWFCEQCDPGYVVRNRRGAGSPPRLPGSGAEITPRVQAHGKRIGP